MSGADPARAELDARGDRVDARDADRRRDDARFDRLALALFAFQFERCAPYRRFCEARGAHARATCARWQDVPAVPTGAFKELSLTSFPRERAVHVFRTSGTTARARARRAAARHARVYEASLLASFRARRAARPRTGRRASRSTCSRRPPARPPDSSLSHMFDAAMRDAGARTAATGSRAAALDVARALRELEAAERGGEPVAALRHRVRVRAPARGARARAARASRCRRRRA